MRFSLSRSFALAALWISAIAAGSKVVTTTEDGVPSLEQTRRKTKRDKIIALVPRLLTTTANIIEKVNTSQKYNIKEKKGLAKIVDNFSNKRRNLAKNVKKAVHKQLLKSSVNTKKAVMKGNKIGKNLGLIGGGRKNQRHLALSDVLEAYKDMVREAANLFEDFVAQDDFSYDEFESPPEFCAINSLSASEDCTQALRSAGTLARTVLMNPVVVYDMIRFVADQMFLLPWEHILDWNELREYLNSIPKTDFYSAVLTEIDALLSDMAEDYMEHMPDVYREVYVEFFDYLIELDSPITFNEIIYSIMTIVDPNFEYFEEVDEAIDTIHPEVCYALTLEPVHIDFLSDCDGEKNLSKIPFCVSQEFKAENNGKAFYDEVGETWINGVWVDGEWVDEEWKDGYWEEGRNEECSLTGEFSFVYDVDDLAIEVPTIDVETPNDRFFMRMKENGEIVTKPCKFLAKKEASFRSRICSLDAPDNLPAGIAMASAACPSMCCTIAEHPSTNWLKKKETTKIDDKGTISFIGAEIETCEWLKTRNDRLIQRFCSKKAFSDEANTAYIACPETCGICSAD